jgi:hypothetical protein
LSTHDTAYLVYVYSIHAYTRLNTRTGLLANFNYNAGDDWESISPSTTWWVAGTINSAFNNPDYKLEWGNRIVQHRSQKAVTGAISLAIKDGESEPFRNTDWTMEDELVRKDVAKFCTAAMLCTHTTSL